VNRPNRPPGWPVPRVASILGADHTAALAFGGPLAGWILAAILSLLPAARPALTGEDGPGFYYIVIFATVAGWIIALWRVYTIRSLFSRGVPAVGQVCGVRSARTWVRVEYRYSLHGRPYDASSDLFASNRALQIKAGDTVALVVDPERPHLALIRDLYL
jgi:hypothetical protein